MHSVGKLALPSLGGKGGNHMKNVIKPIAILLVLLMGFGMQPGNLLGVTALAAGPASSQVQITNQGQTRYYSTTGTEVTASPVLGSNAVVSVGKTIQGTENENEFLVTLDVKTSVDISKVKVSSDAAVVLVLDISQSMTNYMPALISSANNFLDSFVGEAGDSKRYVALVTFSTDAQIVMGWTDVTNPQNLTDMKAKISALNPIENTNMEGGIQLARNLLRTEALPSGTDGNLIENRSVILFSDGEANTWAAQTSGAVHTSNVVDFTAGTKIYGGPLQMNNPIGLNNVKTYTAAMADSVKNQTSFVVCLKTYPKYDAYFYAIAFGAAAPTDWLKNSISTNSSFTYAAANASDLNAVFAAISKRIESWAKAWIVTDPMGTNMEFAQVISPNDISTGLLKFEDNTLAWDIKQAIPNSFINNVYTYTYTYRIKLDTTMSTFTPGISYPTNGKTDLTYVMVVDDKISSDVMTANFAVPSVKGYVGNLDFTKVGDNSVKLAGCGFSLANQTPGKTGNVYSAYSAAGTGAVSFASIPSGHTYMLSEVSMPDALKLYYRQSPETLTVTVAYGEVSIKDSQNNVISNGFNFNNPRQGRTITGLVYPIATDDLGLGDEFLKKHEIVVELRTTFLTPAPPELSTVAVWSGTGDIGSFTIEDVPFGDYLLYIKKPGYLTRCMPVTVSPSDPAVVKLTPPGGETEFNLWGGDVDDSNEVVGLDLSAVMGSLGIDALSPYYNPAYDINADGYISGLDVSIVLANLSKNILDYPGAENVDPWS